MIKHQKINSVTIAGNCTKESRIITFNDGGKMLAFTLAVPTNFKFGNEEEVMFIECEVSNPQTVKFYEEHPFPKGSLVTIQGYIKKNRTWERSDKTVAATLVCGVDSMGVSSSEQPAQQPRNNGGF